MRKILTVQELRKLDASSCFIGAFERKFGTKVSIPKALAWFRETGRKKWEAWILAQTPELTEAFLHYGADARTWSDYAILWAEHRGQPEVVEILKEAIAVSPVSS